MTKKRKKGGIALEEKSVFEPKKRGNFITIKTSLKSKLKDNDRNFGIINELVLKCNEILITTF